MTLENTVAAFNLWKQGNIDEARALIARILKEDPLNGPAWTIAARMADSREDAKTCIQKALQAVEFRNDSANLEAAKWAKQTLDELDKRFAEKGVSVKPIQSEQKTSLASTEILPSDARERLLERYIHWYVRRGYRVISRTQTTAQLVKPKSFSCLLATLLAIFTLGIFLVIYIFYYLASKDKTVYLEMDREGRIKIDGKYPATTESRRASSAAPTQTQSRRIVWIGVGIGTLLLLVVASIFALSYQYSSTIDVPEHNTPASQIAPSGTLVVLRGSSDPPSPILVNATSTDGAVFTDGSWSDTIRAQSGQNITINVASRGDESGIDINTELRCSISISGQTLDSDRVAPSEYGYAECAARVP